MCGIAGYPDRRGVGSNPLRIRRMADRLASRGPDAEGFQLDGPVALGHRRLRIIDLEGGAQPLCNEDGTVWVVFNGEIYNFLDLRRDLERRGHRFATRSDTESIVHAYEEFGLGCFARFNGMFALAIWDSRRERLVLARDRMGKKPLYYSTPDGELIFASELKALVEHDAVSTEPDPAAVARYLAFEYVPAPHSIYRGTKKLPAGHLLTWEGGRLDVRSHWDLEFRACPYPDFRAAAEELRDRLGRAVRRRLVSDVPLGILLSGGVDSSGVAAFAASVRPGLRTFSIGFEEPSFDESRYSRQVSERIGSRHHEDRFCARALLELIPDVFGYLDEPLADPSLLPTYLLCRQTRESVTVALGGDGGDELFYGYPTFQAARFADRYERLPRWARTGAAAFAQRLPVSDRNLSWEFRLKQFLRGVESQPPVRDQQWLGAFNESENAAVLAPGLRAELDRDDPYTDLIAQMSECQADDPLDRLGYQYARYYLAEDILTKVDRASMACSLEVRAPLLDPEVVELATEIPSSWKLGRGGKRILKAALAGLVPEQVLRRPKKGFGIPLTAWLRGPLAPLCDELLEPAALRRDGFFDPRTVSDLLAAHRARARDCRKQLWTLLVFQLWRRHHARQPHADALLAAR